MDQKEMDAIDAESKVDSPNSGTPFDGCDAVRDEVFDNGLLFRKLGKLVSYSDLKICRLVCRRFNWMIVNETDFSARTTFVINEESCCERVLEKIGFTVKHVQIHPFHGDLPQYPDWAQEIFMNRRKKAEWAEEDVEHVYGKLKEIESIRIIPTGARYYDQAHPSLKKIIKGAYCLKQLALGDFDFDDELIDSIEREELRKSLGGVVDLEINSHEDMSNLDSSDTFLSLKDLKRISVRDEHESDVRDDDGSQRVEAVKALLPLITGNKATVECLCLCEPYLWKSYRNYEGSTMINTRFPKLQEVHIRSLEDDIEGVATFLKVHLKQLDALTIRIPGLFPLSLLYSIKEHAAKLNILSIEMKKLDSELPSSLEFIADCKNLKEFSLRFMSSGEYAANEPSLATMFSYVPASVRKLSLVRLPKSRSNSLSVAKIQILSKLNSLKLVGCYRAVTNESLQAIFLNMTSLRELEIDHAPTCTDEGFTGTSWKGTPKYNGVSISNLKILKSLVIRSCGITDRTLIEALRFTDLTFLDINDNDEITPAGCKRALDNNPSLETFYTGLGEYLGNLGPHLKESYPRFNAYKRQEHSASADDSGESVWDSEDETDENLTEDDDEDDDTDNDDVDDDDIDAEDVDDDGMDAEDVDDNDD